MLKTIPFLPFPLKVAKKIGKKLAGVGARMETIFPYLKVDLKQSEIGIDSRPYLGIAFFTGIFYFAVLSFVLSAAIYRVYGLEMIYIGLLSGLAIGAMSMLYIIFYPKLMVRRHIREIDSNLMFALRAILIQIRAGIPLFNAMHLIAEGRYGAVSVEFQKTIDKIQTGVDQEDALQDMAMKNPSLHFRRSIWQIVNGLKGGGDINDVLTEVVRTMAREARTEIVRYGSALRMLSLVYMLLAVIMPALGVTFLIVLSSFPRIELSEMLFWGLLAVVAFGQFLFLGVLKSRRPIMMAE